MADIVNVATRSRMMSGIRRRDTKLEMSIRRTLHARGFRYRTDARDLPGRPDIVLPRWRAVVLIHGCFWHAHDCGLCCLPVTRAEFWKDKLSANAERDVRNQQKLADAGWRIATIWECALRGKGEAALIDSVDRLESWIRSGERNLELKA